jgi:hypothetical protein
MLVKHFIEQSEIYLYFYIKNRTVRQRYLLVGQRLRIFLLIPNLGATLFR